MKTIPVDLILYDLGTLLAESENEQLSKELLVAIDHRSLGEQWNNEPALPCTHWLHQRLTGCAETSSSYTAAGVAVARRLADVAMSLTITGRDADLVTAETLLQAAQKIVRLSSEVGPSAEECSEERAQMAAQMAAELALRPDVVQSGVKVEARNGAVIFTSPSTNQLDSVPNEDQWRQRAIDLDAREAALRMAVSRLLGSEVGPTIEAVRAAVACLDAQPFKEAVAEITRCAEKLGYAGDPKSLCKAVGDACLTFADELHPSRLLTHQWRERFAARNAEANIQADTLNKIARAVNWDRTGDLADAVQALANEHKHYFEALKILQMMLNKHLNRAD